MAFSKPTNTAPLNTSFSPTNTVAPDGTRQTTGWQPGDKPPAQYMNHLHGTYHQWLRWIDERISDLTSDGLQISTPTGAAGDFNLITTGDGATSGNFSITSAAGTGATGGFTFSSGASSSGASGAISLQSGAATTSSGGFTAVTGSCPSGPSGNISLQTGLAAQSGSIVVGTGDATSGLLPSGSLTLSTGASASTILTSGNIILETGDNNLVGSGTITIRTGAGAAGTGSLQLSTPLSASESAGGILLATGDSPATVPSRDISILALTGHTAGDGGNIIISAGDSGSGGTGDPGIVAITAGSSYGPAFTQAGVRINAGDAAAGTDIPGGNVEIEAGATTGDEGSIVSIRAAVAGASGTSANASEDFLVCDGTNSQVRSTKGYYNVTDAAVILYQNIFRGEGQDSTVTRGILAGLPFITLPQNKFFYLPLSIPEGTFLTFNIKYNNAFAQTDNITITVYKFTRTISGSVAPASVNDTTTFPMLPTTIDRAGLPLVNAATVGPDEYLVAEISHAGANDITLIGAEINLAGLQTHDVTFYR